MNSRRLLLIPMFLLIFGPKSSGRVDVVSITSLLLIVAHFLCLNTRHIPTGTKHRVTALLGVFLALLVFAIVHFHVHVNPSGYQVLRFGRVIVNFLGVAALVSFYYRWLEGSASRVILRHLFHCLVIHAFIMAGMFQSPTFRDVVVNQIVQADPDSRNYLAKATGYRIAGLTDSWDALSGLQSFGLLMLPILLTRPSGLSYWYAGIATPFLLFSVAISGRTGFVTVAALLPIALYYADLRRMHRATLLLASVASIAVLLVLGPMRDAFGRAVQESSLRRATAMFDLEDGGHPGDLRETFDVILHDHYFLPETWRNLLLGTGGSGRDIWDYVPADNGPVLNLHNLGIGGCAAIYGSMLWMLFAGWRVGRFQREVAAVCVLAVLLILLIDLKVMYAFSRNGFTVMLLPALVACCELSRAVGPPPTGRFATTHVDARRQLSAARLSNFRDVKNKLPRDPVHGRGRHDRESICSSR
jgi:hypothetical protein